jgi:hypothetical protein
MKAEIQTKKKYPRFYMFDRKRQIQDKLKTLPSLIAPGKIFVGSSCIRENSYIETDLFYYVI